MKIIFYKFYTLEDFVKALDILPKDLEHKQAIIPGLEVEYTPMIDGNDYLIQVTFIHEAEDD